MRRNPLQRAPSSRTRSIGRIALMTISGLAAGSAVVALSGPALAQPPEPPPPEHTTAPATPSPTHTAPTPEPTHSTVSPHVPVPPPSSHSTAPRPPAPVPSQRSETPSVLGESTTRAVKCKRVTIVYAGGFNDPTKGTDFTDPLRSKLMGAGLTVSRDVVQVDFPALHPGLLTAWKGKDLPNEAGTDAAEKAVADTLNSLELPEDGCTVLVGYSTGTVAIEKALSTGPVRVEPTAGNRIAAVELFADPTNLERVPGILPHAVGGEYESRTIRPECNPGDPLCAQRAVELSDQQLLDQLDACQNADLGACLARQHLPPAYKTKAEEAATEATCRVLGGACSAANRTPPGTGTVVDGDTLWGLAEKFYNDGSRWRRIYNANRGRIEKTALEHGFPSSHDGDLIFPGTDLVIPTS